MTLKLHTSNNIGITKKSAMLVTRKLTVKHDGLFAFIDKIISRWSDSKYKKLPD